VAGRVEEVGTVVAAGESGAGVVEDSGREAGGVAVRAAALFSVFLLEFRTWQLFLPIK
jgi:hypothetical protein